MSFCCQTAASMHERELADVLNALNAVPGSAVVKWDLCPRAFGVCCSCASQPATENSTSDCSSRAASNCCHLKGNIISDPLPSLQTHSQILTSFLSSVLKDSRTLTSIYGVDKWAIETTNLPKFLFKPQEKNWWNFLFLYGKSPVSFSHYMTVFVRIDRDILGWWADSSRWSLLKPQRLKSRSLNAANSLPLASAYF